MCHFIVFNTALQTTDKSRTFPLCVSGNVFRIIRVADAHEHAAGVSLHRDGGFGRAAVQLLPPLVRRHLPGQRPVEHPLPVSRSQAGTRETHGSLIPRIAFHQGVTLNLAFFLIYGIWELYGLPVPESGMAACWMQVMGNSQST